MMLKVTDICSTDPKDPTHCSNPSEIKIDRQKAWIINQGTAGKTNVEGVNGDSTPYTWFFMKCWADVSHFHCMPCHMRPSPAATILMCALLRASHNQPTSTTRTSRGSSSLSFPTMSPSCRTSPHSSGKTIKSHTRPRAGRQ